MKRVASEQLRRTWQERITQFRASGQSGVAWCAANGIKEHQFRYWLRRFPEHSGASSPRFVPVSVESQPVHPSVNSPILVRIGVATLEVRTGFDTQLFEQVVRIIATTC